MPAKQKALLLDKAFGQFALGEVEIHQPGPGEILIKVQAAALNPIDWKIQKVNRLIDGYPAILGSDIAGDVETVGEGVSDFKKGDRVFGKSLFLKERGAYQQYVVYSTATASKIPPKFSYDDVSTLPTALATAYSGMYNKLPKGLGIDPPITESAQGKYAGNPIVILGGSSSVGQFAIQLAKLSGFSPIIATASPKHADFLKDMGTTHILDRNLTSALLKDEINKITDKPIMFVYDSISTESTQPVTLDILAPGGHALLVATTATVKPTDGKQIALVVAELTVPHNVELLRTLFHDKLYGFLETGAIKPNRVEVVPNGLVGVIDGLVRLEGGQVSRLKLVAHPQETP
jgi:NADPH:quinone reductase-like Zn-dependent oxidoreductase